MLLLDVLRLLCVMANLNMASPLHLPSITPRMNGLFELWPGLGWHPWVNGLLVMLKPIWNDFAIPFGDKIKKGGTFDYI